MPPGRSRADLRDRLLIVGVGLLVVGLLTTLATLLVLQARDVWRAIAAWRRHRRWRAAARLTGAEAAAFALAAIGDGFYRHSLYATLDEQDGILVWRVASATIDMGVTAVVDDTTGAVSDVNHWSAWPRR